MENLLAATGPTPAASARFSAPLPVTSRCVAAQPALTAASAVAVCSLAAAAAPPAAGADAAGVGEQLAGLRRDLGRVLVALERVEERQRRASADDQK